MIEPHKKRILIFSTAYLPFVGGAELAIKEITDRLPAIEFVLFTARLSRSAASCEQVGNVSVYRIGFGIPLLDKLLLPFVGTIKVLLLERTEPTDLYWPVMASYASGIPYLCNILRSVFRGPRVPIVLTLQEGDPLEHISSARFGLIGISWRLALPRTDFVTTISTYLKNLALFMGYKGKVAVIPNGVDTVRFSKPSTMEEQRALRKQLNLSDDAVLLITTSRLVKKNAVGDSIRALSSLPTQVHLLILGIGEEESILKTLAETEGVSSRVHFLGHIAHEALPAYLAIAQVFVRPSLSEGMGSSFVEAMAAGIPIVATKVGGIPDFLFDGETGLFCEVQNPKSIAAAVERLLTDDTLRTRVIKNAQQLVTKQYDWQFIASAMGTVFDNLSKSR
jgi:glycosyltransferase involved in cell wall biosynthesis